MISEKKNVYSKKKKKFKLTGSVDTRIVVQISSIWELKFLKKREDYESVVKRIICRNKKFSKN